MNPRCPDCGAVMARSAWNTGWVCIERNCDGMMVDCSDCGRAVAGLEVRCAAGCMRVVCDECYEQHCVFGCRRARKRAVALATLKGRAAQ